MARENKRIRDFHLATDSLPTNLPMLTPRYQEFMRMMSMTFGKKSICAQCLYITTAALQSGTSGMGLIIDRKV